MEFIYQSEAVSELRQVATSDRHSVMIEGPAGCGKSYLASEYAKMLNIDDISFVEPTVSAVRSMMNSVANLSNPMLICIENLDTGVPAAAYTLLKFLEEPQSNVYIVVTCRNIRGVPDTILSRSVCVSIGQPTPIDLETYGAQKDPTLYALRKNSVMWTMCRSFADIDAIFQMTQPQLDYFYDLSNINFKDNVSNLTWKLGHYNDNTESPTIFVIRYIYGTTRNELVKKYALQCLVELDTSRVAGHAVLAHFVFNCKYKS